MSIHGARVNCVICVGSLDGEGMISLPRAAGFVPIRKYSRGRLTATAASLLSRLLLWSFLLARLSRSHATCIVVASAALENFFTQPLFGPFTADCF